MQFKLPFSDPKDKTTDEKIEATLNELVDSINANDALTIDQKVKAISEVNGAMNDVHERRHHTSTIVMNLMTSLLPIITCVGGMMFTSLWEESRMTNRNVFALFMETVKNALRKK